MARPRAMPHVGDPVTVVFLAARVGGVVTAVDLDARRARVMVDTADGQALAFELSRATGTFLAGGQQSGARLLFE
jgi:hypothetical protein